MGNETEILLAISASLQEIVLGIGIIGGVFIGTVLVRLLFK